MNIFLLLITTQLLGLCLGYEFEFGRYSIVSDDTRKNQLLVLNGSMQRRRTKQTKDSNVAKQMKRMKTLPEASMKEALDIQQAMMELSMSFSLSMSGPTIPTSPVFPSGPPTINTQSPVDFSPSVFMPPSMPLPPTGVSPPSGQVMPFGDLPPSGPPGPTGVMPPFGVLPPSGPPGPAGPTGPFGPTGPPGSVPPFGAAVPTGPTSPEPLPPTGSPLASPTDLPPSSGDVESSDPLETEEPTTFPTTGAPTETPTFSPSLTPSISAMPTGENDCPKNSTLTLVSAANENSTPVALDMSYSAESNSSSIEEFEEELVDEFIRTAVLAIFGCVPDATEKIAPNTLEIIDATCDPTVDFENECFVMQTTFIIGVEGPVNTDVAEYEVYKAIQENMANGTYTETVPEVVFLEFLSPLPLIPPPSGSSNNSVDANDGDLQQRDVDVSPWTIGFSVASVMGGFVSLLVWARSRRSRRNGLDRMEDTTPYVNPDTETVL